MDIGWGSLPLLPLRCILDYLCLKDALSAMSVSRHWRTAVLLYEGQKETLDLQASQLEKSQFLAQLFRRHARRLHIHIDCTDVALEKFVRNVLPLFNDSANLREVFFIGPSYVEQNHNLPNAKLKRIVTESLVFRRLHSLKKLAFVGCEMEVKRNAKRFFNKHKQPTYKPSPVDHILSTDNTDLMIFSSIQHIIVDYELISTEAIETLSHLPALSRLSLNVRGNKPAPSVDWGRIRTCYPRGLDVAVNIIELPYIRFEEVTENVLAEGMPLTSLKVLFCETLYEPLITHAVRNYKETLREFVWADSPYESITAYQPDCEFRDINPFIMMCWQCVNLRRLVIHGYWVWQYDILGFVRLRQTLQQLEISASYDKAKITQRNDMFRVLASNDLHKHKAKITQRNEMFRVFASDAVMTPDSEFVQKVNSFTELPWSPTAWRDLHPALRDCSTALHRADYVVKEVSDQGGLSFTQ